MFVIIPSFTTSDVNSYGLGEDERATLNKKLMTELTEGYR